MGEGRFRSPLLGRFNLMNLLQAVGVLLQRQLPLPVLLEAIGRFGGVPGRMERVILNGVDAATLPTLLVDYAHTPDGLDNALASSCSRAADHVFGCGGDRDRASVRRWRRLRPAWPTAWWSPRQPSYRGSSADPQ